MIKLNNVIIEQSAFGDGTLKCECPVIESFDNQLMWLYDNDGELFTLISLVNYIYDAHPECIGHTDLILPYVPHARQDRNVSNRLFTLKYFSSVINSLKFRHVHVFDPHSDVTAALIDRIDVCTPDTLLKQLIRDLSECNDETFAVMYPDTGAAKKYQNDFAIIGNKHRNSEGRITSYELINFKPGTKSVLIIDDICSYGGTFCAAAKELKTRGVENIYLYVSHCEDNIARGDAFNCVTHVYTTDDICHLTESDKLTFVKKYRG